MDAISCLEQMQAPLVHKEDRYQEQDEETHLNSGHYWFGMQHGTMNLQTVLQRHVCLLLVLCCFQPDIRPKKKKTNNSQESEKGGGRHGWGWGSCFRMKTPDQQYLVKFF